MTTPDTAQAICPACRGKGCRKCGGSGYVTVTITKPKPAVGK